MRIPTLSIFILSSLLLTVQAADTDSRKYANARFGFVLTCPKELVAGKEPANGAGREFHTSDGEFSVLAQGHFLRKDEGDTFDKRWADELKELGDTVTYKKKAATWFVVSGVTKNGVEFYRKFYAKGSNWVALEITYPHAQNKKYDPWVSKIEKSFVPFREGDFDRLD